MISTSVHKSFLLVSFSVFMTILVAGIVLLDCYSIGHPVIGLSQEAWVVLMCIHTGLQIIIAILLYLYYPLTASPYYSEIMRIFIAYLAGGILMYTLFIFIPVFVSTEMALDRMREYLVIFFIWSLPLVSIYGLHIKSIWKLLS